MRLNRRQQQILRASFALYILGILIGGIVLVFSASCASAQPVTPSPGPDFVAVGDGWVHKDALVIAPLPDAPPLVTTLEACVAAQPAGSTNLELLQACGQFLGVRPDGCEHLNPYAEPERAIDCTERAKALNPPVMVIKTFTLGAIYGRPYGERQILIIGKALGLNGVEVVTAQVVLPIRERGTAIAFLNDGGGDAGQWWPVGGAR